MSQCIKCGTKFIGTAANPPPDGLCHYCERDSLKEQLREIHDQIGYLPESVHPDERKPRAETWLAERQNWITELAAEKEARVKAEARLMEVETMFLSCSCGGRKLIVSGKVGCPDCGA